MCVEVRDVKTGDWNRVCIPNPYRIYKKYDENGRDIPGTEYHPNLDPFDGRDYEMFGILAGVRNSDYTPISENRGIPVDADPLTLELYARYGEDAHDTSWLLMSEMEAFAANKKNFRPTWYGDLDEDDRKDCKKDSNALRDRFNGLLSNIWMFVSAYCCYASSENVRVVFWFDS